MGWDVSNVADMSYMFSFNSHFNGDLSKWDVSKVKNMGSMFFAQLDGSKFNGDLSKWDVSSVTDMRSMFDGAFASVFPGPHRKWDGAAGLSKWNVSAGTDTLRMFHRDSCSICDPMGPRLAAICHQSCQRQNERPSSLRGGYTSQTSSQDLPVKCRHRLSRCSWCR